MDDFTQRMLARAQSRQKKLGTELTDAGLVASVNIKPLKESESNIFRGYDETKKESRKAVVSDSSVPTKKQFESLKENVSDPCLVSTRSDTNLGKSLKSNLTGSPNSSKSSLTRVMSEMPASPKSTEKRLNIQRENFNMEIKLTTAEDCRVEVEIEERDEDDDEDVVESAVKTPGALRDDVKNRLQRLGKLYSGTDEVPLSSPIQKTEEKFHESTEPARSDQPARSQPRLQRLAALANTINQWEDDSSCASRKETKPATEKSPVKKSWKPPAPQPPAERAVSKPKAEQSGRDDRSPSKNVKNMASKIWEKETKVETRRPVKSQAPKPPVADASKEDCNRDKKETKSLKWDKNVLDSLESQGYTRTESTTRLVYNYERPKTENVSSDDGSDPESPDSKSPKKEISKLNVELKPASPKKTSREPEPKSVSPSKGRAVSSNIMNRAAKFETASATSPASKKDPALLPLSERKALFEKNKGGALVPKAAFAMAVPVNVSEKKEKALTKTVVEPKKNVSNEATVRPSTIAAESSNIASKLQALLKQANTISETQILQAQQQERQRELDMLRNRFVKNKEAVEQSKKPAEPNADDSSDDETEVSETTRMIPDTQKGRVVTFKDDGSGPKASAAIPSAPPMPAEPEDAAPSSNARHKRRSGGDSPKVRAVLEDVKRVKVSPKKEGRLYPCLSDIETATEPENEGCSTSDENHDESSFACGDSSLTESDAAETSFGREIMRAVCRNQHAVQKRRVADDSADSSDISDVLNDMNEYLDRNVTDDSDVGPTPPKYKRRGSGSPSKNKPAEPSHSFHYKHFSPEKENYKSPSKAKDKPVTTTPDKTDLPTHVIDEGTPVPLMHTVSFYRKQQSQGSKATPLRQIQRPPTLVESPPSEDSYASESDAEEYLVDEKIRQLQDEVCKQQTVISQASQALNLCCSTIEFSGSSEQVEAERLLLVATHRRHSAMLEIQRLKIERSLRPGGGVNAEKVDSGTLTISEIVLPLKRDYVRALTTAGGLGHHLMCLVRYAERVVPTPFVATGNPPKPPQLCVRIPGSVKLEHVYADFTVTLEVYSMHAHEEILPHEVKYHIGNSKKGSKLLTPKKGKNDSKLIKPPIQSPAGPNAVRSTSFTMIGYVVFSIREIGRSQWTLNKVPIASPLDGSVQMKVNCELAITVETQGFLTMFDDVSGFGAWHRRWCHLKGHVINYWKYPDDEKKKAPIGSINLRGCVTQNVGVVSRDICARPNTFLLEFVRPKQPSDTNSLVTVVNKETTTLRHLLSADTKEERVHWCRLLNKSLSSIKSWGAANP